MRLNKSVHTFLLASILAVPLSNFILVSPSFANGIFGTITVTFKQGKKSVGHGTLNDPNGPVTYIDYNGKPYPSAIDMKNATSVTFTPDKGKERTFSHWEYFFQGGWVGPRLTNLEE